MSQPVRAERVEACQPWRALLLFISGPWPGGPQGPPSRSETACTWRDVGDLPGLPPLGASALRYVAQWRNVLQGQSGSVGGSWSVPPVCEVPDLTAAWMTQG